MRDRTPPGVAPFDDLVRLNTQHALGAGPGLRCAQVAEREALAALLAWLETVAQACRDGNGMLDS